MPTMVDAIYSPVTGANVLIPFYTSPVAAGFPSPADDYLEHLDLVEHLIERPAATFIVRAAGDSMVDAGINTGDLLIVDKSLQAQDRDIVIAAVDGQFMVKRFRKAATGWRLVTESTTHPPVEVDPNGDVEIWGVVIHVIHSPRRRR